MQAYVLTIGNKLLAFRKILKEIFLNKTQRGKAPPNYTSFYIGGVFKNTLSIS